MNESIELNNLTPRAIVAELNKYIIGQDEAKRAVAIALRNRWRREQVPDLDLRNEIVPKNILMIGPTGVGKTEIARRLAKLVQAPFVKVEATKFTEIGYVGRDVDSIIRDLVEVAVKEERERAVQKVKDKAAEAAEERILDALLLPARHLSAEEKNNAARQAFRNQLRDGSLDETEIEIEMASASVGVEIMAPPGMEEMTSQLQSMFQQMGNQRQQVRKISVRKAMQLISEEEAGKMVNEEDIRAKAIQNAQERGIVFIDEIDKVAKTEHVSSVSREGVQRDLLPLLEGSTISTKYGPIRTDHILFIASGAFQVAKPSDLIAELQGRLPIRVELSALSVTDFERILTEPHSSLTAQYIALFATEAVGLTFAETGIRRIAEVAWQVNERLENIGARRLYTVMERLLENSSFEASESPDTQVQVDLAYVNAHLGALLVDEDLSRYIL